MSTAVHEDQYELSVTINFALRGNKDPFVGGRGSTVNKREFLSSNLRKASMSSYGSEENLGKHKAIMLAIHTVSITMYLFFAFNYLFSGRNVIIKVVLKVKGMRISLDLFILTEVCWLNMCTCSYFVLNFT